MIRWRHIAWLGLAALAVGALFQVKQAVQELEQELAGIEAEIREDREALRVLQAEWSYLHRPARLADLARRYLDFEPLQASQMAAFADLPARPDGLTDLAQASGDRRGPSEEGRQ